MQRLVDEGRITAEEASHHPQRSLLIRALDGRGDVELDLSVREARAGDRYLLCSDGLSGSVSEQTIRDTLIEGDPETAAQALVELALRGGGPDNVTVVVADVVDVEDLPSDIPTVVGAATADTAGRANGSGAGSDAGSGRESGAAHRAAALTPRPEQGNGDSVDGTDPDHVRTRSPWLGWVGLLVVGLALGGAGGWGGWAWTQQQYYVGAHEDAVTIFRGIAQTIGPIELSGVYEVQNVPGGRAAILQPAPGARDHPRRRRPRLGPRNRGAAATRRRSLRGPHSTRGPHGTRCPRRSTVAAPNATPTAAATQPPVPRTVPDCR